MSAAIAALLAGLAVVYKLNITTTQNTPVVSLLSVFLDFNAPIGRVLTADEAMTVLASSIVIFMVVFSFAFFVLRFFAAVLAAFGFPDEDRLRTNRELRRGRSTTASVMKAQARLTAIATVRAQVAAQRRAARSAARAGSPNQK
jgi:hypothetical protein